MTMRTILAVLLLVMIFSAPVSAQTENFGNTGSSGSGSSSSGSSSSSSSFSSGLSSELIPTSQAIDNPSNREFIGAAVPGGFVGTDDVNASSSTTSSRRQSSTTTARTTSRTTTARRTTAAAGTAGRTASSTSGTSVRAATSTDFEFTPVYAAERLTVIQNRLTRIPGIAQGQIALQNSPAGTTAVLTGIVKTEKERKLAKQMLLLEPGIDSVDNRLEVR
ncbi:MAG: hypothetical protein LBH00_08315 [Planctomycetaceae bacterium]|jgi:hypothetical protein|nr:hypothetical protein [Planctomycetaceae bacterium]